MATPAIVIPPPDEEELALEKLVFGDFEGFDANLKSINSIFDDESEAYVSEEEEEEKDAMEQVQDDMLFFVDDGAEAGDKMDVDVEEDEEDEDEDSDAWADSDDERLAISLNSQSKTKKLREYEGDDSVDAHTYVKRLRAQFEKIYPRPQWADDEDESEDDEEVESDDETVSHGDINALNKILSSTYTYTAVSKKLLAPGKLDITRLTDANAKHVSKSAIQTIMFHPTHPLVMTGGYDRTLRIYHIDGKHNNVVTTLHLRDSPIQTAAFAQGKVLAGGRRRYMYSWDLKTGEIDKISRMYGHEKTQRSFENFKVCGEYIGLTGNNGWVNVISAKTGQYVKGFKVEGVLCDFAWGAQGRSVHVVNTAGEVWEFDFKSGQVLDRWRDDGGVGITKIALGGKQDRWLALGSESGIVNVYDRLKDKKPVFALDQLVTSISSLVFSPDGQMLCMASRATKDALRIVQLPTGKVFSNWPTSGTPLGKVTSVAFSARGEMLCVGNEGGYARLWRLNHY